MRINFVVWNILHLLVSLNFGFSYEDSYTNHDYIQPLVFEYKRLAETERHCSRILSSGSKLELTYAKVEKIKNEISFFNGYWEQDNNGSAPLMPFDVTDMPSGKDLPSLKLINFEVKDVKLLLDVQHGVGLGGVMYIGITRNYKSFRPDHRRMFTMNPGMSVLTIVFEGVYVETEENMGNRWLCLLGNTSQRGFSKMDLVQDDQLVLILKYPMTFNSTVPAFQGEMTSTNERRSSIVFDKVLISSELGWFSDHQFSPIRQSSSCDTYSYQQELMEDGANNMSDLDFCRIFQEMSNEVFNIFSDHHTNYSETDTGKLGPFLLGNEFLSVNKSFKNVKLVIQNVKCMVENFHGKTGNAPLSAIFRVVPGPEGRFTSSDLSGMTLSAEGMWDSYTGQLCMVGSVLKGKEAKVSMYFPRVLSIRQRSIVFGSIQGLFSPLYLDFIQQPSLLKIRYRWYAYDSFLTYDYSKIKLADKLRMRSQSFDIIRIPKQLFLRYPAIKEAGGFFSLSQIYDFTVASTIHTETATNRLDVAKTSIKLEVLSVGPFLARYDFLYKIMHQRNLADAKTLFNENGLLNVSLHLTSSKEPLVSTSTSHSSVTFLFLEGLYNPHTGKMYLIGCKKVVTGGVHVERGLDCLIEVILQLPPTNLRWLRNPTVDISITSQRNADDPLYFPPTEIKRPITNFILGERKGDVAFRKICEGVVRVVVLVVEIFIMWSQKFYMDQNVCLASSVSFHMFAVEIISFSILLITGEEILLPSKESIIYKRNAYYDLHAYQPIFKGLDYAAKFLALTTLFFNTWLFRKVCEFRKRFNDEDPSKAPLPLGNRRYILSLLKRLAFICFILLTVTLSFEAKKGAHIMEVVPVKLVQQLAGLGRVLHDISLLSQIIENWRYKNQAKSLRKIYYVGLSLLKIMLKLYDRIRSVISDPYIVQKPATLLNDIGIMFLISH